MHLLLIGNDIYNKNEAVLTIPQRLVDVALEREFQHYFATDVTFCR